MEEQISKKLVVVTGATSGIGLAISKLLLAKGFAVIGIGSRPSSCEAASALIQKDMPDANIQFIPADMSSLKEVNALAEKILAITQAFYGGHLYGLINNAGCFRGKYQNTVDGYEYTFALNHLAGFLLTKRLSAALANGVLLFTSSGVHYHTRIHWKDIMLSKHYRFFFAYKQSKLANVMTAVEFRKRLMEQGTRVFAVDPGLVKTDLGDKGSKGIILWAWHLAKNHGKAPEVAALTYAYLLTNPSANGLYFKDSIAKDYNPEADKPAETIRLFELSEKLTSLDKR